jgi:multiple sugar transport system substrate-binding protein
MTARRLSRREFLKLVSLAGSAAVLGACQPRETPTAPLEGPTDVPEVPAELLTVEVSFGYSAGGWLTPYYEAVFARAPEDLPGIAVEPVVYPTYDDLLKQLPTQFLAGTAPDVFRWDHASAWTEYAAEGMILPLNDLLKETSIDLNVFHDALVDGWTIDGKLFAIPGFLQNSAFVYNLDVLEEAGITTVPTSMQEVRQYAQTVKAETGKAGLVILPNLFHIYQYILAFGGRWDYGRTISSPENVAGLQFLVDMFVEDETAATAQQLGTTWDGEAISQNRAAMSDGGPWYIGFMRSAAPDVRYSLLPIPTNRPGESFIVAYGSGYSISHSCEEPEAAIKLCEFLTSEEAQEAVISEEAGSVPARKELLDDYIAAVPMYAAFTEVVLSQGLKLDYPPTVSEFESELVDGFEQLIHRPGTTTVQELLNTLQAKHGQ